MQNAANTFASTTAANNVVQHDTLQQGTVTAGSLAMPTTAIEVVPPSVVSSDGVIDVTAVVGKSTLKNETSVNAIERLIAAKNEWEQSTYRKANDELYALLAQCLELYNQMAGNGAEAKAQRVFFEKYIEQKGIKVTTTSHTLVKIAKCVFGDNRRRASAYGIVLRTALTEGIAPANLPAFIRERGGVEEIRLSKSPNAMTATAKAAAGAQAVAEKVLGTFQSPALQQKLDSGKIDKTVVLVGTWQADGSIVVREVVEGDGAINAALVNCYSRNKTAAATKVAEVEAANDANATEDAITAALQESIAA